MKERKRKRVFEKELTGKGHRFEKKGHLGGAIGQQVKCLKCGLEFFWRASWNFDIDSDIMPYYLMEEGHLLFPDGRKQPLGKCHQSFETFIDNLQKYLPHCSRRG